jgi:FecR protein
MRRAALILTLSSLFTLPLLAEQGRAQSYITYDDGGTIIRSGEDGREVEARVNMPVFPGDEVITARGRAEIRLSDGNVLALDRSTDVRFNSILDSYDGDSAQTVIELRYGRAMVHRTDAGSDYIRLDTESASYVAANSAVYEVESDRGRDHVTAFDGSVEVRTPNKRTRLREGEEARVDDQGYDLISDHQPVPDDFERWFLRRSERYDRSNSRYLDSSLAYADYDLDQNGQWVYVSAYNTWGWRPYVSAGWRPYYHGMWVHSPSGCLVWVSSEPWGWVPYHYGRWAYDPITGWFWLPGTGYAPAWVYWMYGADYVGWAPAGWWDCYKPYYNWCYRPYARAGLDFGFGFFGRVRVGDIDLRPWTFVDANTLVSNRADRAALTTDIVRNRLARSGGGYATVSNNPARFSRNELRDPAQAVNNIVRRGIGGGTGNEGSGSSADVTPFIRRDPDLSSHVRERVARPGAPAAGGGSTGRTIAGGSVGFGGSSGGGSVAPIGGGSIAPVGRGNVAPVGGGSPAPIGGGSIAPIGGRDTTGRVNRDTGDTTRQPDWRDRVARPATPAPGADTPAPTAPATPRDEGSWRGRAVRGGGSSGETPSGSTAPPPATRERGSDVPRRVIDGIGGARVRPDNGSGARAERPRSSEPPRRESAPPPQRSSPPPQQHNDGGSRSSNSGNSGGERVHRDKQ